MEKQKTHELRNRILFTILVAAVYLLCRSIVLYGIDPDSLNTGAADVQALLSMMVSGDRYRVTVMALGIMPYINASLLVQIIFAFRSSASRAKISKMESDRWMRTAAILFSIVMAIMRSYELTYQNDLGPIWALRLIVTLEMIAGAAGISYLCFENEKHGIGASMPIILINIVTSLVQNMNANHFFEFRQMIWLCVIVIIGTVLMENSIIRIPLQRVSIHNVHADQNYLAYKRAPMGIMPVMFAASAFFVPYYFVKMLAYFFPENASLASASENLVLTKPLGVGVYLILIVVLSVVFSMLMLNPKETAHQLQRNGDSIIGLAAGKKTKRYLTGIVLKWSFLSGFLQMLCMAVSMGLSLRGQIPAALAMVPSSVMILVSIVCSFVQEIGTYYRYDAYRFFL